RSADDRYVARRVVEAARTGVGRDDDVFEPHAVPTGEVDPWLHAERVAGSERQVVPRDHVGVLVRFLADAVTDPVHEVVAVTRVGDDAAGGRVDLRARGADGGGAHALLLRGDEDRVDVADLRRRIARVVHARD